MTKTSSQFWDKLAQKYARQPISDEQAYQYKLAETRARLTQQMDVLEFACGTGGTALHHAPSVNTYRAIDYSSEMIRIARAKPETATTPNLSFEVESIDSLSAANKSYDAVLGMSILHLLPNRVETISKVYNLLKPGGYFFSSTVCLGDSNPMIPLLLPVMRFFGKAPYVGIFNGDDLMGEIRQTGFEIEHQWRPSKSAALFVIAQKP